jgi:nicotinate-nucleotide adenylyltransferase
MTDQRHKRILIFGGTFDPPHRAHTELPPMIAERIDCDRLLYVPAALNPLKRDSPPTAAEHRLAMLRLAIADVPDAEVATLELEREGPSYTVDTLEELRDRFGEQAELRLLIGADQAVEFHRWKDWRRIIELATPVVMLRPPWDRDRFRQELEQHYEGGIVERWLAWTIDVPAIDISSSGIRHRIESGEDLTDLLHEDVAEYIHQHGLYRSASMGRT